MIRANPALVRAVPVARSCASHLIANEAFNLRINYEGDPTLFALAANSEQLPITALLAVIIESAREPKERIRRTRFGQPECYRAIWQRCARLRSASRLRLFQCFHKGAVSCFATRTTQ